MAKKKEAKEQNIDKEELETLVEEVISEEKEEHKEAKEPEKDFAPKGESKLTEVEPFSKEELLEMPSPVSIKKVVLWVFLVAILFFGTLALAVFIYREGIKRGMEIQRAEAPTPTPSPTPKPELKLKREDLKVQALNGAGIAGTAGKAREFLEGLGYKNVDTGNASSYDFEETEISIKDSKEDYLDVLVSDLSKEYAVLKKTKTLDKDSDFDVVITIGRK